MRSTPRSTSVLEVVIAYHAATEGRREVLPYEVDGIVARVDSLALQPRLGEVSRSPRWAIAFKFKAQQGETRVRNILASVARIGILTPPACALRPPGVPAAARAAAGRGLSHPGPRLAPHDSSATGRSGAGPTACPRLGVM
jgi:DNA ligase (NAD+)